MAYKTTHPKLMSDVEASLHNALNDFRKTGTEINSHAIELGESNTAETIKLAISVNLARNKEDKFMGMREEFLALNNALKNFLQEKTTHLAVVADDSNAVKPHHYFYWSASTGGTEGRTGKSEYILMLTKKTTGLPNSAELFNELIKFMKEKRLFSN